MNCIKFILLLISLISISCADPLDTTDLTEDRIVGGVLQKIRNRKFQVAVRAEGGLCGGALVRLQFAVTAAHCVSGSPASKIRVRAGSIYYYKGGGVRTAEKFVIFPKYNSTTNSHDIALIKLKSAFPKTNYIGTIAIASSYPPIGSDVRIAGWGTLSWTGGTPHKLRSVVLQTVGYKKCNADYSGTLTKTMMCAAAAGKDSCSGDSGGALTYKGAIVGITSWGNGCANPLYPGVYTRAPMYRNWLIKKIKTM